MTPGWSYALMIVLSFDARAHPEPQWFGTLAECRRHAPVRVLHFELTGHPVAHVDCQRVRMG